MIDVNVDILCLSSGRYKVKFWGRNIGGWNPSKNVALTVPGQPQRGFETLGEAAEWWLEHAWTKSKAQMFCNPRVGSVQFKENWPQEMMPELEWRDEQ